ncbi:MAG: J domain-containing protein [Dehalococcoidales bacterium]|nr:J domain-containing protein [Dehalococcoidales bacterium]
MASNSRSRDVRRTIEEIDRILYRFSGVRLRTMVKKGVGIAGEALSRAMFEPSSGNSGDNLADAYRVLGILPAAPDYVVKAAFRAMVRELHPDTGVHPDVNRFQSVVEAYRDIMLARAGQDDEEIEGPK